MWSAECWVDKKVPINQLEAPVCKEKYLCKTVPKTILNTIISNVNSGPKYDTLAFGLINKCFKKINSIKEKIRFGSNDGTDTTSPKKIKKIVLGNCSMEWSSDFWFEL